MAFHLVPYLAKSVPGVGIIGAVVGGAAAMAKNAHLLKDGKITGREAAIDTGVSCRASTPFAKPPWARLKAQRSYVELLFSNAGSAFIF